jgi:putative ABC transport system permease protein
VAGAVTDAQLPSTLIAKALVQQRLVALLAGFFVVVAMVLAAVGLYGVLSYAVVRRTREIGIRVALGARRAAVVRLVISEIAIVTALGLAGGAAGGLLLARYIETLLYEVKPSDFASLGIPLASLLLAAALASAAPAAPAARAARVEPTVALRYE